MHAKPRTLDSISGSLKLDLLVHCGGELFKGNRERLVNRLKEPPTL